MGGKVFTNDNLTDEVAKNYLEKFPDNEDLFQKIPEDDQNAGDGKGGKKSDNNSDAGDGEK